MAVRTSMPTTPSLAPTTPTTTNQQCTGEVTPFSVSVLLDLEGPPGFAQESDIDQLEEVLKDAYNEVAMCDQPNAIIQVNSVNIMTDSVDGFGDDTQSGSSVSFPFTWKVTFEGECRGCNADPGLFLDAGGPGPPTNGDAGVCTCDFPTVDAYTLECNNRLQEFSSDVISLFSVSRATVLVGGAVGSFSPLPFQARVVVGGTGLLGGLSPLELSFIGSAFLETYNSLNALNYQVCDTQARVITSVVPTVQQQDDDGSTAPPFSIVFNIAGTCRGCGQASVLFGNHGGGGGRLLQSVDDLSLLCPVGAEFRCPSESEFQATLQDTIDRLRDQGTVTVIDTIGTVQQVPSEVLCTESPTLSPVEGTSESSSVDLTTWSTADSNGNWVVAPDNLSVFQSVNGNPTFFCSDFTWLPAGGSGKS